MVDKNHQYIILTQLIYRYNLTAIPLSYGSKVPPKGFQLEKVYNGEMQVGRIELLRGVQKEQVNVGLVCGSANEGQFVVIDADGEAEALLLKEILHELNIETLGAKTRRGEHFYFFVKGGTVENKKLNKVDIIAKRKYVVAPPSTVDGHVYEFVLPSKYPLAEGSYMAEISIKQFEKILEQFNQRIEQFKKRLEELGFVKPELEPEVELEPELETKPEHNGNLNNGKFGNTELKMEPTPEPELEPEPEPEPEPKSKLDKVFEIVLPYYRKGQRQDLVLGLTGFLIKQGVDKESIEAIIRRLHAETGDEDSIKQRLSALENSLKKEKHELIGLKLLAEIMEPEDVEKLAVLFLDGREKLDDRIIQLLRKGFEVKEYVEGPNGELFFADGKRWYLVKSKKQEFEVSMLCGYYKVEKVLKADGLRYEIFSGKLGKAVRIERFDELERYILGFKKNTHTQDLWMLLGENAKDVDLIRHLGWDEKRKVFFHPVFFPEAEFELLHIFELEDFLPSDEVKNKHHELILEFLKEGKLLGAKLVFALAGLWTNFVVIDIAPRGAGKTLTSWFVCQLYNKWKEPLTLWATEVGLELVFNKLKNMPILLDEGALGEDDKVERLIFALSNKRGKLRGTKNLSVRITDIRGVAFLTTEKDYDFSRLGAERRIVRVRARDFSDYTELWSVENFVGFLDFFGAGVDIVKHYMENRERIDMKVWEDDWWRDIWRMGEIPLGVAKALALLEDFYQTDLASLREKIIELFSMQHQSASESVFNVFLEKFSSFIAENLPIHFAVGESALPRLEVWGKFKNGEDGRKLLYIITDRFRSFCKERGFDVELILRETEDEDLLIRGKNGRRVMQRVGGALVSCYCFDFSKIEELLANKYAEAEEVKALLQEENTNKAIEKFEETRKKIFELANKYVEEPRKKVSDTVLDYLLKIRQAEEEGEGKGEEIFKQAMNSLKEEEFKELVKSLVDEGLNDYGYGITLLSEEPKDLWTQRRAILILRKYEDYLKHIGEWSKFEWLLQKEEEINKALKEVANRKLNEFKKVLDDLYSEINKNIKGALYVDEDKLISQLKYAAKKGVIDADIRDICEEYKIEIKGPYAEPELDFSWFVDYLVFMRSSEFYFGKVLKLASLEGVYSFTAVLLSLFVRAKSILNERDLSLLAYYSSSPAYYLLLESSFDEASKKLILHKYKKHFLVLKSSLEELINDEVFGKLMREKYAMCPNWKDACKFLIEKCKALIEESKTLTEEKEEKEEEDLDWLFESF